MKRELRLKFRKWMNENVTQEYSKFCGESVAKKLFNKRLSNPRLKVSIFISKFPEISTFPLIDLLFANEAEVYIPAWHSEEMWMCRVDTLAEFHEILKNTPSNKIPMPSNNRIPIQEVVYDFIIIPGLVFDKNCHRLGYGYGHYDYFLSRYFSANPAASSQTKLIGIGYDKQIYDKDLPFEDHDFKLDEIVTPSSK